MQTALTIAGSDPTGGAGIQADLQVFRAHGLHGAAVVSALTIQDTAKVHRVLPVFPTAVLEQIRVLFADFQPNAVKIGMLATDDIVRNTKLALDRLEPGVPVVIDPVLAASDGAALLERRALSALRELIEGRALVTPNLAEAETLGGCDTSTREGCEAAARAMIEELAVEAVLVKGGHREGRPDDLLARRAETGVAFTWLEGERIPGDPPHGTGCALSAAIAARLALGHDLEAAIAGARRFVAGAIAAAEAPGGGARLLRYGAHLEPGNDGEAPAS